MIARFGALAIPIKWLDFTPKSALHVRFNCTLNRGLESRQTSPRNLAEIIPESTGTVQDVAGTIRELAGMAREAARGAEVSFAICEG